MKLLLLYIVANFSFVTLKREHLTLFSSPWKTLKKSWRLVNFDIDGNIQQPQLRTNDPNARNRPGEIPSNMMIDTILNLMNDIENNVKPPTKLKILSNCKEQSWCRFLTCPKYETECIFCEVKLKPPTESTENSTSVINYDVTEGRGVGTTLWGWITYPFSWWSSEVPEQLPNNDQLIGSTTRGPYDSVEVGNRNITVWCNDQTCTTQKCDKFGCKNKTCNIYDTDMKGECREFNTDVKPEEPLTSKPTEGTPVPTQPEKVTEILSTKTPEQPTTSTTSKEEIQEAPIITAEERPIELEAMLSSTVPEADKQKTES